MSRMLSKMNLISVVQQLPKEDIETIQGYVEMIEQENNVQKVMIENFVKENQELKEMHKTMARFALDNEAKIDELENQQKEFIECLENEIKRLKEHDIYEPLQKMALATNEHILAKYKEIIGNDINVGSKGGKDE